MTNQHDERQQQDQAITESLSRITHKLLVMSGKGGVGKSSIAVNLAAGLAGKGFKVGLMDVDLHGPSIPQMLGLINMNDPDFEATPESLAKTIRFENDRIIPARYSDNLSVVSIECMLDATDSPVIWRGPMKIGVIRQFIADVEWNALDYLVIDSPPGTGDEPLTVAQTITDAAAVVVTTPQAVSLRDVRKSINFCRKVNMPIAGLIENMSGFICPECGRNIDLFKVDGGKKAAEQMETPFLGRIPILPAIVEACDNGVPAVTQPGEAADAFISVINALVNSSST